MDKAKDIAHKAVSQAKDEGGTRLPQTQDKPGLERDLEPKPMKVHHPVQGNKENYELYKAAKKLEGKRALITGGDSGIGRSVAIIFAMEGATVAITYLPEEEDDAQHTKAQVEKNGGQILLCQADLRTAVGCKGVVERVRTALGGIDILVNNVAYQVEQRDISAITEDQWQNTFRTNVDSYFYMSKYCLEHMGEGSTIINTASVDAYIAPATHLDYAATKGAVIAFTRALANQQVAKNIRVNAVAPGAVWTPLLPSSVSEEGQKGLASLSPMNRIGQPSEIAPCYVFLASADNGFMTGQTLHPNGGIMVGS